MISLLENVPTGIFTINLKIVETLRKTALTVTTTKKEYQEYFVNITRPHKVQKGVLLNNYVHNGEAIMTERR